MWAEPEMNHCMGGDARSVPEMSGCARYGGQDQNQSGKHKLDPDESFLAAKGLDSNTVFLGTGSGMD